MRVLVTGSCGLIGSEMVRYFHDEAELLVGIDNNSRQNFFGPGGDTRWNLALLQRDCPKYVHRAIDIRNRDEIDATFRHVGPFDLIIHCAAQPSHDLSARRPLDDFDVNATGTMNLLEATRIHAKEAAFVFLSTSKVYGDTPNRLPLVEHETRYDFLEYGGIDETMSIERSVHSPFGASKVAADVMVQEYGRYFGMHTACLRGGCLTGGAHSPVELHGFLAYLVKCQVQGLPYTVFGYKGKQVRDNIHGYDVARAVDEIRKAPTSGAVYNIGGGRKNSISILEAFERVESFTGQKMAWEYEETPRRGDHIVYISDTRLLESHYPEWKITRSLDDIILEIIRAARERSPVPARQS